MEPEINVLHNKFITLFPLRLEIRYIKGKTAEATFNYESVEDKYKTELKLENHDLPEQYRIRWFPDEIELSIPAKAITDEETEALERFFRIYLNLKNSTETITLSEDILKIYNHLIPGELTDEEKQQCENYNQIRLRKILLAYQNYIQQNPNITSEELSQTEVGLRIGWEVYDLENPVLSLAWQNLLTKIGVPRARFLVSQFLNIARENLTYYMQEFRSTLSKINMQYQSVEDPIDKILNEGIYVGLLPPQIHLYTIKMNTNHIPQLEKLVSVDIANFKQLYLSSTINKKTNWGIDFKRALEERMAVIITHPQQINQINSADWLIAFGVYDDSVASNNIDLEMIFKNLRAHNKLAIALQDMPTNNTEQSDTSYKSLENDLATYITKTKMQNNIPAHINTIDPLRQGIKFNDAQLLSYLLEINSTILSEIPGADENEQKSAQEMASLLWEICTRFIKYELADTNETNLDEYWDILENIFVKFVRAGGPLPVLQASNNPYGILPIANLNKLFDWSNSTIFSEKEKTVLKTIDYISHIFSDEFKKLAENIPTLTKNKNYETLLEILRLTSVSNRVNIRHLDIDSNTYDPHPEYLLGPLIVENNGIAYLQAIADGNYGAVLSPEKMQNNANIALLHRLLSLYLYRKEFHQNLDKITNAARYLLSIDTKKLEILMMGIFDLLSFRLDAWITALATIRLYECRNTVIEPKQKHSAYGVYGWLEKPGVKISKLNPEYIQAPSLKQAATSAILKNSFNNSDIKFNLNAEQVRKGLLYFEMLRKGYSVGEILGYRLERMIHDARFDSDIYKLRELFPLSTTSLVDGKKFIENFDRIQEDIITPQNEQTYKSFRDQLQSVIDAAADIAIAESTHQLMKGNSARAAAWLDFMEGKVYPPEIEFLTTSRTGTIFNTKLYLILPATETLAETHPLKIINPELALFSQQILENESSHSLTILVNENKITQDITELNLEPIDFVLLKKEDLITKIRYRYFNNQDIKINIKDNPILQKAEKIKKLINSNREDNKLINKDPYLLEAFKKQNTAEIDLDKMIDIAKERLQDLIQILENINPEDELHKHHLASIGFPEVYNNSILIDDIKNKLNERIEKLNKLIDEIDSNDISELALMKINKIIGLAIDYEDAPILIPYILKESQSWQAILDHIDRTESDTKIIFNPKDYELVKSSVDNLKSLTEKYQFHSFNIANTNEVYFTKKEETTDDFKTNALICLFIDQWSELIPHDEETTGIAINYPTPKAQAPNAILMAVPQKLDNINWSLEELGETIASTISLMHMRLVTLQQIQENPNLSTHLPLSIIGLMKSELPFFSTSPFLFKSSSNLERYFFDENSVAPPNNITERS